MAPGSEFSLYKNFGAYTQIPSDYYTQFDIKRGLRNADGTGVLAGVTSISNVHGYLTDEGRRVPDEGRLTIRGYDIKDLVGNVQAEDRFGYEELAYLLCMGDLPTEAGLARVYNRLDYWRDLPDNFVANLIMNSPSNSAMNMLARSVLLLYSYDKDADLIERNHEIDVFLQLMSRLPRLAVLSYLAKGRAMYINPPQEGLSTAETILYTLRRSMEWDDQEAKVLDIMLMLHAEHGGGNNSTFTTRVLTSSGTDAYSAYAGGISSLKGPRHGGANIKAVALQRDCAEHVADCSDEGQVADYLRRVLRKEANDGSGLIYGMGHAIYTLSDPRAIVCKELAERLALGTEAEPQLELIKSIERLAPEVFAQEKGSSKAICANIDMYSGLVYQMLGIPEDLFTPLFAVARLAGWAAHRFEEIIVGKRIIRPAYKALDMQRAYVPMSERTYVELGASTEQINQYEEAPND